MADFDWKAAVRGFAPTLGGLLTTVGGPAGALAGVGISVLASALGCGPDERSVAAAVQAGLTPEQRLAIIAADADYKKALLASDIRKIEIVAGTEKSILEDVADARAHNAQTVGILRLGYGINAASYTCLCCVIIGCFWLLGGAKLTADPGTAAMVGSIIGAAVQWLMSNAAQANSFFFGSSPGSRQTASDLAKATSAALVAKDPQ